MDDQGELTLPQWDPSYIDGYRYNPDDGNWYESPPEPDYGQWAWLEPADPDTQTRLDTERARQIDAQGIMEEYLRETLERRLDELRDLYRQAETTTSPIILDLDGDGVETLSLAANIHFDHDGNGFAEQSGWVGGDDALLVRDINANGQIDNGTELFGNNTLLANGTSAANGFAALAALNSNGDGVINANDTAWTDLRLWRDANNNAHVDEGELITLGEAGVAALNLGYTTGTSVDAAGNAHKQIGSFVKTDGSASIATDVWFAADMARTVELDLVAVSETIAALPDMQGFGNVYSLHQAMARDDGGRLQSVGR